MKSLKFILALLFVTTLLSLTSCSFEPLVPAIDSQANSSGDYWPTAINNNWSYQRDGSLYTTKIASTETVNGQLYYKFLPQNSTVSTATLTATTSLNKKSGVYKLKFDDLNINANGFTGTQTGYEFIILKDNLAVGETWSGSYTQTTTYTGIPVITTNTTYTGTILEKNTSETVNTITYTDIIKVKITQTTAITGSIATTIATEYWFAKKIGVIKSIITSNGSVSTSILEDYTLL